MALFHEGTEYRVLIAESRETQAESHRKIVQDLGMSATVVLRGGDSLLAIQASKFDLLVINDKLPDMDIDSLILLAWGKDLGMPPFIIISEDSDFRHALRMLKLGARDFLLLDDSFKSLFPETLAHVRKEIETERKLQETELTLKHTQRLYKIIAENLTDVIFIYNSGLERFSYISPSIFRLCGIQDHEALSMSMAEFIEPDEYLNLAGDLKERITAFRNGNDLRKSSLYRLSVNRKNRKSIRVDILTTLVWGEDGGLEILGVARDVEERARMEESVLSSLKEKEILLQEVHHRVKNNLQIIISLINLQIRGVKDGEAATALQDSQNRIRSMALIHEQLYRSPSLADINFPEYVQSFVPILLQCADKSIRAVYDMENLSLSLDFAVPCGLILNELVMNGIKHAFNKVKDPEIRISFRHDRENSCYVFVVADNGSGLPYEIFPDCAKSLGFTLVTTLVEQLSGRMEMESSRGACFTMTFPAGAQVV